MAGHRELFHLGLAVAVWSCLFFTASIPAGAQEPATAWQELVQNNPHMVDDRSFNKVERQILKLLNPKQLRAWLAGTSEQEIFLLDGQSLADFLAQHKGASFVLSWFTVDGGGGVSSSASYLLGGTVAQPDVATSTGSVYTLSAGFWSFSGGVTDRTGLYRNRLFVLDTDGSATVSAADTSCLFGIAGDLPITGDWNGDGQDEIGVYRRATAGNGLAKDLFLLDLDGSCSWNPTSDRLCEFGLSGGIPIIGDWNGDGDDEIGLYLNRLFFMDFDEGCTWTPATDRVQLMGLAGDQPLIGDWNGDGDDNIGVYRPANRLYLMDLNEDGTWSPDSDRACLFGLLGDEPIVGDWDRDGDDGIGVRRPPARLFLLDRDDSCTFSLPEDGWAIYGLSGDLPLVGKW